MTLRRLPSRHQSRSRSSNCGDSIALRSLRPLPCSMRISMRVLSMSPRLSAVTSDPQPGAVSGAECRVVFRPWRRLEQPPDFLDAQHIGKLARVADDNQPPRQVWPVERDGEEEAQFRNRRIDAGRLHPGLGLVDLEPPDVFDGRRIGGTVEESSKAANG